ncbi:MAG: hypothetical protein ACRYG8_37940 [Janthinobacterium lividum]
MTGFVSDARWRAASRNLCSRSMRLAATADDLSRQIEGKHKLPDRYSIPERLATHIAAFADYTVALACVQALLAEADVEVPPYAGYTPRLAP